MTVTRLTVEEINKYADDVYLKAKQGLGDTDTVSFDVLGFVQKLGGSVSKTCGGTIIQKVCVSPDGDPVQEFIQLKYAFDFALMSIEEILCDGNLHYDYAKILEDLHKHEKKVRELLEYRIIRNNHAANEYYLKLQELCRVSAGRVEDLTVSSLS